MGSENEPAKLLLPYLQRADELQKHEALVAYYCRLYAMEKGLRIPQNERTKTTNSLLISLMKQLEKDKKSLKLGPEDNLYLEGFALNVFGKADKQDRAGRADLSTAKTFYAASIFFEIITQFGELQPDLEQKQKYAVWKAADIRKDLGRSESAASNAHPESDPSPQFHDQVNDEQYTNIPPSPLFHDKVNNNHTAHIPPPSLFYDSASNQRSTDTPPPSYPTAGYPSHDFHPPPPASRSENSAYAHPPPPASRSENSAYANHTTNNPTCKTTTNNPTCKSHHTTNNPTCKSHHTTNNPTCKNLNHISHIITNLMKLPRTLIPTSSLIQVSQRVVSHQYHCITHHTIRVLILPTSPSQPLPQAAIHQLHSTLQAA
ncbi:hydroxyproline-rich glycoprotein [Salix suchowensis]|nr:hydroxyproline-rich glycoprotein [Salix suchowensis]